MFKFKINSIILDFLKKYSISYVYDFSYIDGNEPVKNYDLENITHIIYVFNTTTTRNGWNGVYHKHMIVQYKNNKYAHIHISQKGFDHNCTRAEIEIQERIEYFSIFGYGGDFKNYYDLNVKFYNYLILRLKQLLTPYLIDCLLKYYLEDCEINDIRKNFPL
jgi:hypothetical protein